MSNNAIRARASRSALACALAFVLTLHASPGFADDIAAIHATIDSTVWRPFKSAFERMDGEALNALYADDVLRVTPQGIDTTGAFKAYNATRFEQSIANGERIDLDFWLDSRQTNATTSYDVGFYRVTLTRADGQSQSMYGQFHIVLKKIEGRWQIVQDWDTESIGGRPLDAADFARRPAAF